MQRPGSLLPQCALLPLLASALFGQGSSGTISRRVVDPTGSSFPGAQVKIQNDAIKDVRTFTSAQDGDFVFADIQLGTYTLTGKASGFKLLQKTGLVLTANAVLGAGDVQLALGAAIEVVEVKADATGLQTASGDRVPTLDNRQVMDLMARRRRATEATIKFLSKDSPNLALETFKLPQGCPSLTVRTATPAVRRKLPTVSLQPKFTAWGSR